MKFGNNLASALAELTEVERERLFALAKVQAVEAQAPNSTPHAALSTPCATNAPHEAPSTACATNAPHGDLSTACATNAPHAALSPACATNAPLLVTTDDVNSGVIGQVMTLYDSTSLSHDSILLSCNSILKTS